MATFGVGSAVKQLFSEDNGNLSSMRVLSGLVVGSIMLTWTVYCIRNNTLAGFSLEDIGLILGVLGVKSYQKKNEK